VADTLILGGRGFLGRRVTDALDADIGGRSGPVRIDLQDPSSFTALEPYARLVRRSLLTGEVVDAANAVQPLLTLH